MNTIEQFKFLASSEGAQLLAWAGSCGLKEFNLAAKLREKTTPENAAAITQTLRLRSKAKVKFCHADKMLFTTAAYEQASAEVVTSYRAKRFAKALTNPKIIDLCCSIGSDALPLAEFADVVAVDLDPLRLEIAKYNLKVYGKPAEFIQADVTKLEPAEFAADAFFIDPARRDKNGKRIFDPYQYLPSLDEILRWQKVIPNACAKLGPGVNKSQLPDEAEVEFISVNGELREACLWFGDLRTDTKTRATLLPSGQSLAGEDIDIDVARLNDYLIEPDAAVTRAGLVGLLGSKLQAMQIDPHSALLTSDKIMQSDFAKYYTVQNSFSFDLKRLKKEIKDQQIGNLEIKCRGSVIEAEELRKKLKLKGRNTLTLFLLCINQKQHVIFAKRCQLA